MILLYCHKTIFSNNILSKNNTILPKGVFSLKIIEHCYITTDQNQKQLFSHTEEQFPCTAYLTNFVDHPQHEIPWHWHNEIELVLVKEGDVFVDLGEASFTLKKGQCLFLNTNVLHFMQKASVQSCILHTILFDALLVGGYEESIYMKRYITPLLNCQNLNYIIFSPETHWQKQCIVCFQKAYDFFTQEPKGFLFGIREQLSYICYGIAEHCRSAFTASLPASATAGQRIKQMLEYIHTQYSQPIALKQLAACANISQRECFRCFQTILHTTPMEYITKYRITTAMSLLKNTTDSITEIAVSVGFNNPSYFSKIFKKYTGFTPLYYRKTKNISFEKTL
mgnify:CR=1 FL=1